MITTPNHLNSNVLAAVSIKTSGPYVGFNDVVSVCIIPLNGFFEPAKGVTPFLAAFAPVFDEYPWLNREEYLKYKATGIRRSMAGEVLSLWFKRLDMAYQKKLAPVVFDWSYQSCFLKDLFGSITFEEVFMDSGRDVLTATDYINDCCDAAVEAIPFPKPGFQSICNRVNYIIDEPKDTLNLARATAEVYKRLLKRFVNGSPA